MKKTLIFCLLAILSVVSIHSYAQAPQAFKYQSVARNASGLPIASANIGVRVRIHNLTETGAVVYSETHTAATNAFGVFSLSIGGGTPQFGAFNTIDWASGAKFIEIEADFSGGTTYTSMGASQLLSVPYALYSSNGTPGPQGPIGLTGATGAQGPTGFLTSGAVAGNTPYWDGTTWVVNNSNMFNNGVNVGIGTSTPLAKLDIAGNVKIVDGTQGIGKVLTSDATGVATWSNPQASNPCALCETTYLADIASCGRDEACKGEYYDSYLACRIACDGLGLQNGVKIEGQAKNSYLGYAAKGQGTLTDATAIGAYAIVAANNSTAIGAHATVTASNTIQLGDANVTKVYAGTGTAVTLVAGGLQITGGTPAAGKVLTSDVAGLATWQMPASLPTGTTPGQMMYWNGTTWVILVPPANNGFIYTLKVVNGSLFWEAGDTDGDGIPDSDEAPECINDPNC